MYRWEGRFEEYETASSNNLTGRERTFYDALTSNEKILSLTNDETLKLIAVELKVVVEKYATVDWAKKKSTQSEMRMQIKYLLKKYNTTGSFKDKDNKT